MPIKKEVTLKPLNTSDPKPKKGKLSKKAIDIIRTTQRNNIDLTAIADNKANVLLSLNALMIAVLFPVIITNLDIVLAKLLYIPISVLALTCFITIYIAAQVLKPSDFDSYREGVHPGIKPSPFFFGNFYKESPQEYYQNMEESFADNDLIRAHIAQDLYYVGKRLGHKMSWVRMAYNFFLVGLGFSLFTTVIILFFS